MKKNLTSVVILDLQFSGYGAVRSLKPYNIPIIGFYKDKNCPESKTKLCNRKIFFNNNEELIEQLVNLPECKYEKPVLIITTDEYVTFFIKNRELLEKLFLIDMPNNQITELLLDKNSFSDYALKHNIKIPISKRINEHTQINSIKEEINFPAILKPYLREQYWVLAGLPKAFYLNDLDEYKKAYDKAIKIEKNLIIQEWIPGNDSNVYYCLTYYSKTSSQLNFFNGQKIRQWPVGTGSTATTCVSNNEWVMVETNRIFQLVKYKGFGSIEFKKHAINGEFYLMEPTVGRLNQQEYVATLNGNNIPLTAYNYLTKRDISCMTSNKKPIIYIDELFEVMSTFKHLKEKLITFNDWLSSLKGHKAFRYYNKQDLWVLFGLFKYILIKLFEKKK